MTPTSDERRRVAERLRDEAAGFRRIGEECDDVWTVDLGDVPAIFQDIAHYAGLDGTVRADALFDRLADLIDPTTCQMVECIIDHGSRSWGMRCTACGEEFEHMKPSFGWSFCPNCGARLARQEWR